MDTLRLTVENLARIRRAEVEIKPLTVFFGRNNTNKSYMAHVVYGFYKYLPYSVEEEGISFENFYSVAEFLTEAEEEVRHILKGRRGDGV